MNNLDTAIKLAVDAHLGQVDKAGKAYILHPLRLMMKFEREEEMIVAVLHDVVEDSSFELTDFQVLGFSQAILDAVECLTKRKGEPYSEFIARIQKNALATKIKIEDIKDNLNLARLNHVEEKDVKRAQKYIDALKVLSS